MGIMTVLTRWELEVSDDGVTWRKLGVTTAGGFNPYRYEDKDDAQRALDALYPAGFRRVVRAEAVMGHE